MGFLPNKVVPHYSMIDSYAHIPTNIQLRYIYLDAKCKYDSYEGLTIEAFGNPTLVSSSYNSMSDKMIK